MTVYRCNLIITNKQVKKNFNNVRMLSSSGVGIPLMIWLSKRRQKFIFSFSWHFILICALTNFLLSIVSFLVSFPDLLVFSVTFVIRRDQLVGLCTLKLDEDNLGYIYKKIGKPFQIIAIYMIPLCIIILSYARLVSFLMLKDKKMVVYILKGNLIDQIWLIKKNNKSK